MTNGEEEVKVTSFSHVQRIKVISCLHMGAQQNTIIRRGNAQQNTIMQRGNAPGPLDSLVDIEEAAARSAQGRVHEEL